LLLRDPFQARGQILINEKSCAIFTVHKPDEVAFSSDAF